jgi:ketosteroid isomerase-like protein
MQRLLRSMLTLLLPTLLMVSAAAAQAQDQTDLLQVRETVWRAWFDGDAKTLEALVPTDTIVMSGSEENWKHQREILESSTKFHADGGKLIRLEFPRTEVQHYGDVAIVWSSFLVETEQKGQRSVSTGRITEIFVRRDGHWTNPGWHSDSGK